MTLHRGKIATHPEIIGIRPMTREDMGMLLTKRVDANGRPLQGAAQRFRDPHHRVARLFASGLRKWEVAERSGYSVNRIETLYSDPAFQELVSKYRAKVDAAFIQNADEFYEQATANMRKAEAQLAEKLEAAEESGELLPTRDLIAISGDRMDRFGYGKRQTNLNVNADFASLLEKAIARSGKTIEGSVLQSSAQGSRTHSSPTPVRENVIDVEATVSIRSPEKSSRPHPASQESPQPAFRRRA